MRNENLNKNVNGHIGVKKTTATTAFINNRIRSAEYGNKQTYNYRPIPKLNVVPNPNLTSSCRGKYLANLAQNQKLYQTKKYP